MSAPTATKPPRPQPAAGSQTPDDLTVRQMLEQIAAVEADPRPDAELLPSRLSPSRAGDYKTCPQLFWFVTIAKLSSPPTEATARGTITHTAFERTFDHPPAERTPALTKSYILPAWHEVTGASPSTADPGSREHERAVRNAQGYLEMAPPGSQTEKDILAFAEQMVDNWYAMERIERIDPTNVTLPNGDVIDGREIRVGSTLGGALIHGIIDRVDTWTNASGTRLYSVSDYKTGKIPGAGKNYRQEVMDRIAWDSFFQLRLYAVLLWEERQVPVSLLRLLYVANGSREEGIKTLQVTQAVIDRTRAEIAAVWSSIKRDAARQSWPTRVQKLCEWCYFASVCPAFDQSAPQD